MTEKDEQEPDIFDELNKLIDTNKFDIETIDGSHPKKRAELYQKLRELLEEYVPDIIDKIKYAGREELNELERKLEHDNDIYRLKILKVIRAIFYC